MRTLVLVALVTPENFFTLEGFPIIFCFDYGTGVKGNLLWDADGKKLALIITLPYSIQKVLPLSYIIDKLGVLRWTSL